MAGPAAPGGSTVQELAARGERVLGLLGTAGPLELLQVLEMA
jgi:hypothetical protein